MIFDDHGFAWSEATTAAQLAGGERVFVRGHRLRSVTEPMTVRGEFVYVHDGCLHVFVTSREPETGYCALCEERDGTPAAAGIWRKIYIAKEEW